MVYRGYIYNSHDGGATYVYDTGRIDTDAPSGQQCLSPDPQQFGSLQDVISYAAAHGESLKAFQSVAEVNAFCSAILTPAPPMGGGGTCVNCPAPGTSPTYGGGTTPGTTGGSPGQTPGPGTGGLPKPGTPGTSTDGGFSFDAVLAFLKTPLGWLLIAVLILWAMTRD